MIRCPSRIHRGAIALALGITAAASPFGVVSD
jgi:hypothetical protein